ncbi:Predicted pyrophosphatase or phosphodiesterase, AlkP superfamily [Gracilibacillus ureilyticus]|uniref:Predicted pyrophosphatase or phosphodiesterase, AlkP superfamily n=1 Tax=Gracilibacillus ureilyticus TaxID=531814 RepID=A0A1H9TYG0_9BACI|nr:nucleotide pyrophosphatase/phosphodiesterase family protein [Gracilibacillus ureilyticus]SES02159.1 Predicted pyrophosphatase or phosphodiesterase, AlkP superfamily [Gracilibacillus ureilyticus]
MDSSHRRVLIIGADGLRPDLINNQLMPTLTKLIKNGTRFRHFKSAYPSETRVSMSTLTTGVYPGKHGIVANRMYIPCFNDGFVQTGNDQHLLEYTATTQESILLAPTLGDRLHRYHTKMSVAASSSPGASLLWNINFPEHILNPTSDYEQTTLPDIIEKYGELEEEAHVGTKIERSIWATDVFIAEHLPDRDNQVMVLWLAEPDFSQHFYGLGSPEANLALQTIDQCLAKVLQAIEELEINEEIDLLFLSDHGHSNVEAIGSLEDKLKEACEKLQINHHYIVTGNYIYLKKDAIFSNKDFQLLIQWFQEQNWCDAVYTNKQVDKKSQTAPIESILGPVTHNRTPDMIINPKWTDERNVFGVAGTTQTLTNSTNLRSNHGTLSPYDRYAVCIGYGPRFDKGATVDTDCNLVDIAPTVFDLLGLDEEGFDGRSLLTELKLYKYSGVYR